MVNGTLIVQACNFLVVYFVLKKFLFHPAVDALVHDKQEVQSLYTTLDTCEGRITKKMIEKQDKWKVCQRFFASQSPSLEKYGFFLRKKRVVVKDTAVQISDDKRKELVDELKNELVKRFDHV
jgi:hypothetical protein